MEPGAPSVERRLKALEVLHTAGIRTYLFISPIFPYITDIKVLIDAVQGKVDQICFENLNLRGTTKDKILSYIAKKYPQYLNYYKAIYLKGDMSYWEQFEEEIKVLSKEYTVPFVNYFYHAKIRKGGKKHD
jgi:DNA repair photolyase